jgi:uncharacterized protein (TIGR03437 family)
MPVISERRTFRPAFAWIAALVWVITVLPAAAQTDVLTANYDNLRTSSNLTESRLNTANVNPRQFGRLYSLPVDGQVYAQPLHVSGLVTPSKGPVDVVFIATMHNSVYAFPAGGGTSRDALWHVNLGPSVPASTYDQEGQVYTDISREIGILSTPVIDRETNTMYVVAATLEDGTHYHKLHALNIVTGEEVAPPTTITGKAYGIAPTMVDGVVPFESLWQLQRPALLLLNGTVYIAFGSHGDAGSYHGWIFGYSAADISRQTASFCSTPDGEGSAIWMGGQGLVADEGGFIYAITGNGQFNGETNFGQTFLKLDSSKGLAVADWFTPAGYEYLNDVDLDIGSSAPVVLPQANLVIGGGKQGKVYVLRRDDLGKLVAGDTQIVQSFKPAGSSIFNRAVWNRPDQPLIFIQGFGDKVKAFAVQDGAVNPQQVSESVQDAGLPFHGMTVSSSGFDPQTAILWTTTSEGGDLGTVWDGIVHAYSAADLSQELWNSALDNNDRLSSFAKFANPTVANGRVYVPTFSNKVDVFGLKSDISQALPEIEVVNAFSRLSGAVSPGELVSIRGRDLGISSEVLATPDPDSGALPTSLNGITVAFDDQLAVVVSVSPDEIRAVVPYAVAGKEVVNVQVTNLGLTAEPLTLDVAALSPGISTLDGSGSGPGAFVNEDGVTNGPESPAAAGSVVVVEVTGLGVTDPANDTQIVTETQQRPAPAARVSATMGGRSCEVLEVAGRAGQVGAILLLRLRIPADADAGDAVPVVLDVEGVASQTVTVAIQNSTPGDK